MASEKLTNIKSQQKNVLLNENHWFIGIRGKTSDASIYGAVFMFLFTDLH